MRLNQQAKLINFWGLREAADRVYFEALAKMLLGEFDFPGRHKHPSTDSVNALLSLSYTISLIFNEISSFLDRLGFDHYLAYYHSIN